MVRGHISCFAMVVQFVVQQVAVVLFWNRVYRNSNNVYILWYNSILLHVFSCQFHFWAQLFVIRLYRGSGRQLWQTVPRNVSDLFLETVAAVFEYPWFLYCRVQASCPFLPWHFKLWFVSSRNQLTHSSLDIERVKNSEETDRDQIRLLETLTRHRCEENCTSSNWGNAEWWLP
jgi:hypothetical protein